MPVSIALFSGLTKVSTVPAGNLSKAALVGANTVNGPALDKVSTRPAALTAATRVVWSFELTAFSTMFLVGYMGAPPTILVMPGFIEDIEFDDIMLAAPAGATAAAERATSATARPILAKDFICCSIARGT